MPDNKKPTTTGKVPVKSEWSRQPPTTKKASEQKNESTQPTKSVKPPSPPSPPEKD